ncbi:MAG TPA: phosphatase PAP2 family protein [Longimicrobiales bacterium]
MRRTPAILALTLIAARAAPAQESSRTTVRGDVDHFFDDVVHVWTSPFRADADAIAPLIAVTATTIAVGLADGEIQAWLEGHPDAAPVRLVAPLRDSSFISKIGYTRTMTVLSAGLYGAGLLFDSDAIREAGIGCLTADIANTLARHGLARLLGRLRPRFTDDPYVIRPLAFGDWPLRSFPAGHIANIMACTAFWDNRFDLGVVGPALYVLGIGIGLGRVLDGAHWTSDSVFGAIFGWAVGRAIADRFLERRERAHRGGGLQGIDSPRPGRAPVLTIEWRIPV